MSLLRAVLIVLCADPREILRERPGGDLGGDYAEWCKVLARIKLALCPWYW